MARVSHIPSFNSHSALRTSTHSAELLFLVDNTLEVGEVHYRHNADAQKPALAISAFGSANAGIVSIPSTLFTTTIDGNQCRP
ncbi:unnamed protein product [Prunus armeniaca]